MWVTPYKSVCYLMLGGYSRECFSVTISKERKMWESILKSMGLSMKRGKTKNLIYMGNIGRYDYTPTKNWFLGPPGARPVKKLDSDKTSTRNFVYKMDRYSYQCGECGGEVHKTPTGEELKPHATGGSTDRDGVKRSGLHGWGCLRCGKSVKVRRNLLQDAAI